MTEKVYAIMENRGRHPTRATRSRPSDPNTGPCDRELDRPTLGTTSGARESRTYGLFIDAPHATRLLTLLVSSAPTQTLCDHALLLDMRRASRMIAAGVGAGAFVGVASWGSVRGPVDTGRMAGASCGYELGIVWV